MLTSTLGVLTGDICDALLDTSGSAAVLSELEREQLFTTSTDAGLTYHYHQVLQTHLEVVLVDELGAGGPRTLFAKRQNSSSRPHGSAAAIRAHARAEDWASVARLLKPGSVPVAGDEALWACSHFRALRLMIPVWCWPAPGGWHGMVRIAEAVAAFRHAEALLDDPEFRRRCTVERSAAAVWLPNPSLPPMPASYETGPDSMLLRLSLELRELTRQVPRSRGIRAATGSWPGAAADRRSLLLPHAS